MYSFSELSKTRLEPIHPALKEVVYLALELSKVDFTVIEGRRTYEKQKEYVERGVSWTLNSRHLTGHAVDLAPYVDGKIQWENKTYFKKLARAMFKASQIKGIQLEWGGFWSKTDKPHWQLPWDTYPIHGEIYE